MSDVFLSYSREDLQFARRVAEGLIREGFSVWWDQTLSPGESFDRVTERALAQAKAVAVLWSKTSVDSHWVRAEATEAHSNGNLVPAMIEPCKRPIMFELTHAADLTHWKGDPDDARWQAYVSGVRRMVHKDSSATVTQPIPALKRRPSVAVIALVVLALLLAAGGGYWALGRRPADEKTAAVSTPAATAEVSLAVLPFADMSPAKDQEYFSDGLTEEILNELAQIRGLAVTARTSSFSFKGKNEDIRSIGQKLGVANILEGSVRKEGSQVRITTQLINSVNGVHLWSRTYDRELSKVFDLQEEIAKDVAKALSIRLDVGEMNTARGGTTDIEAYDKFLQARALLNQDSQRERMIQATQLLREAVQIDPAFVFAWSDLADALSVLTIWMPESEPTLRKEAAEAQAHVLRMAPGGLAAQSVNWTRLMKQHNWVEAAVVTDTIARVPEGEEIRLAFLVSVGRFNEAITHMERLKRRDPLSLWASTNLQLALNTMGRTAEAQEEYQRGRALEGDHSRSEFYALWRLMVRKDQDRTIAREALRTALTSVPLKIDASLADKLDDPKAASAVLRKAYEDPLNQESLRMSVLAIFASMIGDRDMVLAALRRGLIDFNGLVSDINPWLPYEPGLRADPRFKELLRDLGLVDYFRASGDWGDFCKAVGPDDFECR